MKRILLALATIVLCAATPLIAQDSSSGGAPIIVKVVGFPDQRGRCACALYNKVQGFPSDRKQVYRNAQAQIGSDNTAVCEFKNIPTGTYAIALFHDAKLTGKMAKNFMGIPQEGYGFSNDCKPHTLSAPTFQECAFQHDGSQPTNLTVTLQHF